MAEIDRRQVPTADGCRSLTEWVTGRLDVTSDTARRLVSTGRRLSHLPHLTQTLTAGEAGFERVEALTRVATPDTEHQLLAESFRWDMPGLCRRAGLARRTRTAHEQAMTRERSLVFQHAQDGSGSRLWGTLPGADAAAVEDTLSSRGDTFPTLPDGTTEPLRARMATALVAVCHDHTTPTGPQSEDPTTPVTVVTVDAALAAATGGQAGGGILAGPRVGIQFLDQLLCNEPSRSTCSASTARSSGSGTAPG